MAYVYRHIRLDKNEPFYIGIGSDEKKFKRAFQTYKRNRIWCLITSKTSYDVEIFMSGLTWDEAQCKEKELIALYGRISDGGILANITIGGDGILGVPAWNKGKKMDTEYRNKLSLIQKIRAADPSYIHGMKGKTHTVEKKLYWSKIRKGRPSYNKGLKMGPDFCKKIKESRNKMHKPILAFAVNGRGCFIFKSLSEAEREMGFHRGNISNACKKRVRKNRKNPLKTYKGYIWEYKENISPEWFPTWATPGIVKPFFNSELPPEAFIKRSQVSEQQSRIGQHTPHSDIQDPKESLCKHAFFRPGQGRMAET